MTKEELEEVKLYFSLAEKMIHTAEKNHITAYNNTQRIKELYDKIAIQLILQNK